MNTSGRKKSKFHRSFVPATALAQSVSFDETMMKITFTDGRMLCVPLIWFPRLLQAKPAQRAKVEIGGGGIALHWPDLDEDLSIAGLMAGVDKQSA